MKATFDYQGAKEAGISDEDIYAELSKKHPNYDAEAAMESGVSLNEINEYLSSYKPKKSFGEKAARVAGQFALGVAENALLPYEVQATTLASKPAQTLAYKQGVMDDIERLVEQKQTGVWDQQDQDLLDNLTDQIKHPEKMEPFVKTADIGVRGIAEKVTGADLHPEGVFEKAAGWTGFLKNLPKSGITKADSIVKALIPSGRDVLRGAGAGAALELAEQGEYGPVMTMGALVAGDLLGGGTASVIKGLANPKALLAKASAKFAGFKTPAKDLKLQKDLIKDFREAGLQADLGTLTNSNLIKTLQSRLAQSGLTGKALDEFREELTSQIKREYKGLADTLGEARYATMHEAGTVAKEGIKSIREADLATTRKYYDEANKALKEAAYVNTNKLNQVISRLEKELKPGRLKSTEQQAVLNTLEKLKTDIMDANGNPIYGSVKDLMNNKIAINDIINYEVQGGAKQLLKSVVGELDRAIISHGKENPRFARNYIQANKKFSEHAKTFRNKEMNAMLNVTDPSQLMNRMNTVQGIRTLGNVLGKTPEGKQIFDALKKTKLDKTIGDNLVDSSTQQVKLGTFSKLLEKGKNREVIQEVLGKEAFKRLERLQKNAGKLADAANKFYNASKTGTAAVDATVLTQGISALANILMGNPWPIVNIGASVLGARRLSGLLADPEFLKLAEEAILASEKGSPADLINAFEQLRPFILPAMKDASQAQNPRNPE